MISDNLASLLGSLALFGRCGRMAALSVATAGARRARGGWAGVGRSSRELFVPSVVAVYSRIIVLE